MPATRRLKFGVTAVLPSRLFQTVWSENAGPSSGTTFVDGFQVEICALICEIADGSDGCCKCAAASAAPDAHVAPVGVCESTGTNPSLDRNQPSRPASPAISRAVSCLASASCAV